MSALAEALVAAQRRALSAMEKRYAAGQLDGAGFREIANGMGLTDSVDQDRLLTALETIRVYGAQLPAEPKGDGEPPKPKLATNAQVDLIQKMLRERNHTPLAEQDLRRLPMQRASTLIDVIGKDTYDPAEWDVAF